MSPRSPTSDRAENHDGLGKDAPALGSDSAASVELAAIEAETRHPLLNEAIRAFLADDLASAERLVRRYLNVIPRGVAGLCLLADIAERLGIYADAAALLDRALAQAPHFTEAIIRRANLFLQTNDIASGLALLSEVPTQAPDFRKAAMLRGRILGLSGDYVAAEETYREFIARFPDDSEMWCLLGEVLKTLGRSKESLAAFRKALAKNPSDALAWWSISNLKSVQFSTEDITAMEALLTDPDQERHLVHLNFALGKAYEDLGEATRAFNYYEKANALRLASEPYDSAKLSEQVDRSIELFSAAFFQGRRAGGHLAFDPIFIVGMPRAGSTLVEQMLASHSLIEGTAELSAIPLLVHETLVKRRYDRTAQYPNILLDMSDKECSKAGQNYMKMVASNRKTTRPHFIDKLPNNWLYIGFIKMILPNAKIIDVRRSPMACCFSNFKQHFARGQEFTYSLIGVGSYYSNYVRFMRHMDQTLPGQIARVFYEDLVGNAESTLRDLTNTLEIDFETNMLRFHTNTRAVRTASAEQVRKPLDQRALEQWRVFEPLLDPLKLALGNTLTDYR